jgi:hypothetical protein
MAFLRELLTAFSMESSKESLTVFARESLRGFWRET